jgi:hypothetical protein
MGKIPRFKHIFWEKSYLRFKQLFKLEEGQIHQESG